jgi:hypothetical protein
MSIKSQVHAVLNAALSFEQGIEGLKADSAIVAAREEGRDALRALLLPCVASWPKYAVPLVVSEARSNKGATVMDSTHAKYDAATKFLNRLLKTLMGEQSGQKDTGAAEEIEVPANIAALAAKLVALCNEYEGAKKLAALAVAQAFAAK